MAEPWIHYNIFRKRTRSSEICTGIGHPERSVPIQKHGRRYPQPPDRYSKSEHTHKADRNKFELYLIWSNPFP